VGATYTIVGGNEKDRKVELGAGRMRWSKALEEGATKDERWKVSAITNRRGEAFWNRRGTGNRKVSAMRRSICRLGRKNAIENGDCLSVRRRVESDRPLRPMVAIELIPNKVR
jgi:hypothetical protein